MTTYTIYFFQITFGSITSDWANSMLWTLATWYTSVSESIISADRTVIYTLFSYGMTNAYYIYFTTFSITSGSVVGTRFKSNINWYVCRSTYTGTQVVAIVYCTSVSYIMVFDTSSNTFTNLVANSTIGLYDIKIDQSSARQVLILKLKIFNLNSINQKKYHIVSCFIIIRIIYSLSHLFHLNSYLKYLDRIFR